MSFVDFVLSVLSSLVASVIFGFLTNTLISKSSNDSIVKIYTIFVSGVVFIVGLLFAYVANPNTIEAVSHVTEFSIFSIYNSGILIFIGFFVIFAIMTLIFLVIRQIELNNKSRDKKYHEYFRSVCKLKDSGE